MNQKPIAVSLFSGGGGLDIGLEDAGFEVRCAIEWNKYACETLRTNKLIPLVSDCWFDDWFNSVASSAYARWDSERVQRIKSRVSGGRKKHSYLQECSIIENDIKLVSSQDILDAAKAKKGEIDLIAGGPPCQSFSRSGKQTSVDDDRGQLFMQFVRVVRDIKPRWFLFENVKGLILTKTTIWKVICSECGSEKIPEFEPDRVMPNPTDISPHCEDCGSLNTSWKIENKKRAGALELIISEFERIGYHCAKYVLNAADYGAPQHRERLFIVGSRDNETFRIPYATHHSPESFTTSQGLTLPIQQTLWDALFKEPNPDHHWPLDPDVAVLWVKNVVRPHDEPVTWTLLRPSPTIGAHQSAKLAIAPFGVPPEQLARQQWHVLGRRQGDTKPVPVVHSYLSDADLLKLQTFPNYWFVAGTRMERAFQIGNAVPPILAKVMGQVLLSADKAKMTFAETASDKDFKSAKPLRKAKQLPMF
jgi:DNA (cytosine-5)-methyltransferase 1